MVELLHEQEGTIDELNRNMHTFSNKLTAHKTRMKELEAKRNASFANIIDGSMERLNVVYRELTGDLDTEIVSSNSNDNVPLTGIIGCDFREMPRTILRHENTSTSRYATALAIMLYANQINGREELIIEDCRTLLSDHDLPRFLEYIFKWTKQLIIVMSQTHNEVARAERIFWLYRKHWVRTPICRDSHGKFCQWGQSIQRRILFVVLLSQDECKLVDHSTLPVAGPAPAPAPP